LPNIGLFYEYCSESFLFNAGRMVQTIDIAASWTGPGGADMGSRVVPSKMENHAAVV
jgi:hypothetical protein